MEFAITQPKDDESPKQTLKRLLGENPNWGFTEYQMMKQTEVFEKAKLVVKEITDWLHQEGPQDWCCHVDLRPGCSNHFLFIEYDDYKNNKLGKKSDDHFEGLAVFTKFGDKPNVYRYRTQHGMNLYEG